jgi:hypothetical protein
VNYRRVLRVARRQFHPPAERFPWINNVSRQEPRVSCPREAVDVPSQLGQLATARCSRSESLGDIWRDWRAVYSNQTSVVLVGQGCLCRSYSSILTYGGVALL